MNLIESTELIINSALQRVPKQIAAEIRAKIAGTTNKLLTLQTEMYRKEIALSETTKRAIYALMERELFEHLEDMSNMLVEGDLKKNSKDSLPGFKTWASLDNNNSPYDAYRYGIALAGSPTDESEMDKHGPVGGDFVTIAYTDVEAEIANKAAKKFGAKSKTHGSKTSQESADVHTTSPVSTKRKNKYGV